MLGSLGGMGKKVEDARKLRESAMRGDAKPEQVRCSAETENTYLKGAAFGTMVMKERLELLNTEGMAKSILYPTIGLLWEAELFDAELSAAYCRAYNRWIADFCRDSGGRLIPIAHLSLGDPAEAARETRTRSEGWVQGRVRLSVYDHAGSTRRFASRRGVRGGAVNRRPARDSSDLRARQLRHPPQYDNFGWAAWYYDLFAGRAFSTHSARCSSWACSTAFQNCAW